MAQVNIKPISDLNQYNDVLKDVKIGSPVYLTKNGKGKYVIFDINDPEINEFFLSKIEITDGLIKQIKEAEMKANKDGWITIDDLKESMKKSFPWLK